MDSPVITIMETQQKDKKSSNEKKQQNLSTTAVCAEIKTFRQFQRSRMLERSAQKRSLKKVKKEEKKPSTFNSTDTSHLESVMDIAVREVVAANTLVAGMNDVNKVNKTDFSVSAGTGLEKKKKENRNNRSTLLIKHIYITSSMVKLQISEKPAELQQKKITTIESPVMFTSEEILEILRWGIQFLKLLE